MGLLRIEPFGIAMATIAASSETNSHATASVWSCAAAAGRARSRCSLARTALLRGAMPSIVPPVPASSPAFYAVYENRWLPHAATAGFAALIEHEQDVIVWVEEDRIAGYGPIIWKLHRSHLVVPCMSGTDAPYVHLVA
jgi:hypothetical protein